MTPDDEQASAPRSATRNAIVGGIREASALVWIALKSFILTVALSAVIGLATGLICAWILPAWVTWKFLIVLAVLALFVAEGFIIGIKHAIASGVLAGVRRFGLASRAVNAVFDGLDRAADTKTGERLQLRKAEEKLAQVIASMNTGGGWLLGGIQRQLLFAVGTTIVGEFRKRDAQSPGVDLAATRQQITTMIDGIVEEKATGSIQSLIWIVWAATAILAIAAAVAVRMMSA